MKIKLKKQAESNIKTIEICAKCSDCFGAYIKDDHGKTVIDIDGYVPKFMPGDHYGDYVQLTIDLETGHILNWPKPATLLAGIKAHVRDNQEDAEDEE